jgi:hypothetical protein
MAARDRHLQRRRDAVAADRSTVADLVRRQGFANGQYYDPARSIRVRRVSWMRCYTDLT